MQTDAASAPRAKLGPHVQLQRIEAVVNVASGSVGANPAQLLRALTSRFGLDVHVADVQPSGIAEALGKAVEAKPDLLILVAGDGTAALAAKLCGMDGPLLAPLPGGTMNMLPHALYGQKAWPDALEATLSGGAVRTVSGGQIDDHTFYVAAILGAPALWADAREAMRKRKFRLAFLRARRAMSRAFSGSLRFSLNGGERQKAEALTLMCPLVSRALRDDDALEAATLNPRGAGEAFRLGLNTMLGKWRDDPAVSTQTCTEGQAWARSRIPVILDGEPHRLDSPVTLRFIPQAFRALAPLAQATQSDAAREGDRTSAKAAGGAAASQAGKSL